MYILATYFLLGIGIKKHVRSTVVQCYSIYPFNILKINSLYIKIKGNEYHYVMNVDTSFQAKKKRRRRKGFIHYCMVECVPQLTQSND